MTTRRMPAFILVAALSCALISSAAPAHAYTPFTPLHDTKEAVESATVNILCAAEQGTAIRPISGSGVFIGETGVILTNAHIAQYFLLEEVFGKDAISCVVRTGNPARAAYVAELLYIPPSWVRENAGTLAKTNPKGTGEGDFALLRVSKTVGEHENLPEVFPHLSPRIELPKASEIKDSTVTLSGYPAESIPHESIIKNLPYTTATTTVDEIYTFAETGERTIDLLSVGGSEMSQKGASGGAVVTEDGELLGLIVTSSREETVAERDLRAITLAYIDRTLTEHTGFNLTETLAGDPMVRSRDFARTTLPALSLLMQKGLQ